MIMEDALSLRQKYREIISKLMSPGAIGMAVLLLAFTPLVPRGASLRRLVCATLLAVVALLLGLSSAQGAGLLIPEEKTLPPLAMLNHQVTVSIEDQVAQTRVDADHDGLIKGAGMEIADLIRVMVAGARG